MISDITIPDSLRDTLTPLDEIHPYPDNPKDHPEAQLEDLAGRIRKDGWDVPIVVDSDGEIVKGHARYQVARDYLDMDAVPVVWNQYDSEADKRAARIHDNQVVEAGEWNDDLLAVELDYLDEAGADVAAETGLAEDEVEELREPADMQVPDSFDEVDDGELEFEHECPECGYEW